MLFLWRVCEGAVLDFFLKGIFFRSVGHVTCNSRIPFGTSFSLVIFWQIDVTVVEEVMSLVLNYQNG